MNLPSVPDDIIALADERAAARARRDYRTADELKVRIEGAGWKVVDFGVGYELEPVRPADVVDNGRTLFGAVESVPSRLDEPATAPVSVIVVANGQGSPDAALKALEDTAPPGTQVLVVAGPQAVVEGPASEVIATAVDFPAADALQAGLRRASGAVIVMLEPEREPTGDIVTPLVSTLGDASVAIAAAEGLLSADLHRYHPADQGDATTVASGCYAFRRADLIKRGPVDARLRLRGSVAAWLGLLLRDDGPDTEPRRAVVIDLPLAQPEAGADLPPGHARLARRDGYRLADRFRGHGWLTGHEPPEGRVVGDGTEERNGDDDADEAHHAGDP